jgi:apolipoprotein N-acyltransferase
MSASQTAAPSVADGRFARSLKVLADFFARRGRLLALPLGALLAAAFAPAGWVVLSVACPAALMLAWHGVSPREAAIRGSLFTAGTYLAGTYWIYHSVHEIGQAPAAIGVLLVLGLAAIMGAYVATMAWLVQRHAPPAGALRWLLVLPAAWVLVEWFRGWFLSGFPWLALGYAHLDTPLAGFAPVLGFYGVSLASAVSAGAVVTLLLGTRVARVAAAVAVVALWGAGFLLARHEWTAPRGTSLTVALVQGAVPQKMKWEPGQRERTERLYLGLTRPHFGADIIVWPEVAIPALESDIRDFLGAVRAEAGARGSALVMGQLRRDPAADAYYNAIVAWDPARPAAEQWYDKRRLVPFGEFFPVPATVREWLRLMSLPYSDFERGAAVQPPLEAAGERLAPTICYEDAYGELQLPIVRQSTLLVNVSNDAWFGDSTAPHQHLDISRMRALETGRPTLRATNNGVTALIGHDGRVHGTLAQFQPGVLTGRVDPRSGLTPYLQLGNVPVLVLLALGIGAGLVGRVRSRATGPRE